MFVSLSLGLLLIAGREVFAQDGGDRDGEAERQAFFDRVEADILAGPPGPTEPISGEVPCVNGFAGSYVCENVDLLAFMPLATIGGGEGNDIWGWTDPLNGKEYAIMGRTNGTSFIDISDPVNPVYLGNLPPHTGNSIWRDIKVYSNVAYIVSEAGGHGMQVFDLTRLRNVISPPVTFTENAHYDGFGNAHNLVINEETGYAFAVGSNALTCSGGLVFVNLQSPLAPTGAGCFSADGYTHDAQCVNYSGPDTDHQGKEICFASNGDTVTVVDVTDKSNSVILAKEDYPGFDYTHQAWITEDHTYLLLDDEGDEIKYGHKTRTRVWDISNLDNPVLIYFFDSAFNSIDHNLYILDGYAYQSNYTSGLQILDLSNIATGPLIRAGYFDTYIPNNNANFNGSWSNYPFFESGVVVVSDINSGLFILEPNLVPGLEYLIHLPVVIKDP
ncbi:MAG TPA: choice-of-anchor B family protein [Anaerolineales bacterium]|nr:choice-of-anchor B family protein [Anaerolineales bacterium]